MRFAIFLSLVFALAACGDGREAAAPLLADLNKTFRPGLSLQDATADLQKRGATTSTRSPQACAKLVEESRVATQLPPRGGPCVFGKIPVAQGRFGLRTDVILQLVFDPDGKLVDASFEAIES